MPGIFTEDQVASWRKVTDAVHAKGGLISVQLWHTGRVAHPDFGTHPLAANGQPSLLLSLLALSRC